MPITRTQFSPLFQLSLTEITRLATLDRLTDMSYDEFPPEYTRVMNVETIERESKSDFAVGGFGLPRQADGELGGTHYDTQGEWFPQHYVPIPYNLGYVISHQMRIDDKWGLAGQRTQWLARSFRRLPEVLTARMFAEGFSATTPGTAGNLGRRSPDGVPLFSASHPNPGPGGGTQSNTNASGGVDLSHASVEAMMIRMASRTDDRGMPVNLGMKTLMTSKALYPRALEILSSSFRTDAVFRVKNVLPNVMAVQPFQNHFLTSPSAYFGIAEPSMTGLKWIWRERPTRYMWTDPATRAIHYSIWCIFDYGWSHYFGVDGDPGGS